MIFNSRAFWVAVVAILVFVARFFNPAFPIDEANLLAAILFVLSLVGIVPQLNRKYGATFGDLLASMPFWMLVASLVSFGIHFYFPTFPLDQAILLAVIVFVLNQFGINPTLARLGKG